jgi:cation transport regulator
MPYKNPDELPDSVKNVLPEHAREIYLAAYNNAQEQYADPRKRQGNESLEEVSHKVAWAAVKQDYAKDEKTGKWKKI